MSVSIPALQSPCNWEAAEVGGSPGFLTTVGFVRVIATIVHPITLPNQADAHPILTLEAELVALLVEFRVLS